MRKPEIVLIGGDGGRSGVPTHISHLCGALEDISNVTILSDVDRGGYGFAGKYRHIVVPGLATTISPFAAIRASGALRRNLAQIKPDLVWAHARMALPLARWALRKGDLGRLVVTYHGIPFGAGHGLAKATLSKAIESISLRVAAPHDAVFLTEEDQRQFHPWLTGQRSHVLQNCSLLGGFSPATMEPGGDRHLVMITRDSGQKNLDRAARIFGRLPMDFRLSLYGMGTDAPGLRNRFTAILGPQKIARVRFCGPTDDVRGALSAATGLLVTSRYEGLSISMIEAMEMGLPVFSTPVGGTALIGRIHPAFGFLTDDLDQSAGIIDRITRSHLDSSPSGSVHIHQVWAKTFAPEDWAQNVQNLVRDVLSQSR